jgi:hypothetical protein
MPTFSIDILARFAQFQDALHKMARDSERTAKRIDSAFGSTESARRASGSAFRRRFAAFIKGAIDAQDKLNDLSKSTGISVENRQPGFAATSGPTDGVAKVNKLNIQMAEAARGTRRRRRCSRRSASR